MLSIPKQFTQMLELQESLNQSLMLHFIQTGDQINPDVESI
jgi:hypothetical protein